MTAPPTAPVSPKRSRGRPVTPAEAARVRRLVARRTQLDEDTRTLLADLDDVRETELSTLLGIDRATLRRLKTTRERQ